MTDRIVLLVRCRDRPGIVAAVGSLLAGAGANIVHADQHTDRTHDLFLQRVEAEVADPDAVEAAFGPVAADLGMTWELHRPGRVPRIVILVSRQGHCLADLLARVELGELRAEVAVVVSNHADLRALVERHGVPFVHADQPDRQEHLAEVERAVGAADADVVVLARYMQILPPGFIERFGSRTINIHHSFLPAFVGARPYHQAYERGVKLIGATAHYATDELDEGPIIAQDVTPVSHRHEVEDLIRLGSDLEKTVLARAVRLHLEHRVLTYMNRTVVFD